MLFTMPTWVNRTLLATALLSLMGCSLLHPARGVKACRYGFRSIAFSGFDGAQTNWRLDMSVVNPNPHPVTLNRMHFALKHGEDTLLSGWNPQKQELAAGDSQVVHATLQLPNAALSRLPPEMLINPDAQFTLIGDAYLDTWLGAMRFPGAFHQTIHVNMPEQIARYRDMMMRQFFGGFTGPRDGPQDGAPEPGQPPDRASPPANDTL
jgi:hypothetical protein